MKERRRATILSYRRRDVKRPRRILFAGLFLAVALAAPLCAAEGPESPPPQYSLGDQTLSINAGFFTPLFLLPSGKALLPNQLSLGGMGTLNWMVYVAPQLRLGVDIGGTFAFSPNMNTLLMLPITAKASWVFPVYPFEIPVSLGIGMNVVKYVDQSIVDLLLKPGASLLWIYNSSWSFGVNAVWWLDFQFAADPSQSRVGNFLEISLSALYHY